VNDTHFTSDRRSWKAFSSLPDDLRRMLEETGEPAEQYLDQFIKAAWDKIDDDQIVINACLVENGGRVNEWVKANGGRQCVIDTYTRIFSPWHGRMRPELRRILEGQGEASEEKFETFIRAALRANTDEDIIIQGCLDHRPPYGGCIYEYVKLNGGENCIKKTIVKIASELPPPVLPKDEIRLMYRGSDTDIYWREVQKALKDRQCPVFVRNKRLVWPCWRFHKDSGGRHVLAAELEAYSHPQLADVIAHHAVDFRLWNNKMRTYVKIDPPKEVVAALLSAHHYSLLDIVGIIIAPTLRPNLTLLDKEGYDQETQLWYKSSGDVKLPPMSERPTKADALAALKRYNDLLSGFPFENDKDGRSVSRSAALAMILTAAVRGALTGPVPCSWFQLLIRAMARLI